MLSVYKYPVTVIVLVILYTLLIPSKAYGHGDTYEHNVTHCITWAQGLTCPYQDKTMNRCVIRTNYVPGGVRGERYNASGTLLSVPYNIEIDVQYYGDPHPFNHNQVVYQEGQSTSGGVCLAETNYTCQAPQVLDPITGNCVAGLDCSLKDPKEIENSGPPPLPLQACFQGCKYNANSWTDPLGATQYALYEAVGLACDLTEDCTECGNPLANTAEACTTLPSTGEEICWDRTKEGQTENGTINGDDWNNGNIGNGNCSYGDPGTVSCGDTVKQNSDAQVTRDTNSDGTGNDGYGVSGAGTGIAGIPPGTIVIDMETGQELGTAIDGNADGVSDGIDIDNDGDIDVGTTTDPGGGLDNNGDGIVNASDADNNGDGVAGGAQDCIDDPATPDNECTTDASGCVPGQANCPIKVDESGTPEDTTGGNLYQGEADSIGQQAIIDSMGTGTLFDQNPSGLFALPLPGPSACQQMILSLSAIGGTGSFVFPPDCAKMDEWKNIFGYLLYFLALMGIIHAVMRPKVA